MTPTLDYARPLKPSGNLGRRRLVSRFAEGSATAAAVLAVAILGLVVYSVVRRGADALSLDFLITNPPKFGGAGGGVAAAVIGTAAIVAVATAMATPVAILTALYLTEFAQRRSARAIGLALDLLNGLPSIVVGVFIFGLLVAGSGQSGLAAAAALAIIMLPLIARATQGVLLQVPQALREAGQALGVSRWRTVLGVLLPTALSGILTATVLGVARAAGETAPLLLADSIYDPSRTTLDVFGQAVPNIPILIFQASENSDPSGIARAWGAGFVLVAFILVSSLGARWLLARSRRMNAG